MADFVQLDTAAALVGKSEVTLRRLVKAGKIPFSKEKTATGFIYRVDPEVVRAYYAAREAAVFDEAMIAEAPAPEGHVADPIPVQKPNSVVRVAIASETSTADDYWRVRAERYEERYNSEVQAHSHTREELGVWRGRAEQAQTMVMKYLPSGEEHERQAQKSGLPTVISVLLGIALLVIILGVFAWVTRTLMQG